MITKKYIVLVLLLLIVVSVIGTYKMYNKPHINVAKAETDLTLEYKALLNDFETNESEANIKYLDQIIEVTGPIAKIKTVKNSTIISLGEGSMFGNVTCHLTPEESVKNLNLNKGQEITVKGICTGYLMDVILVKSVLIN